MVVLWWYCRFVWWYCGDVVGFVCWYCGDVVGFVCWYCGDVVGFVWWYCGDVVGLCGGKYCYSPCSCWPPCHNATDAVTRTFCNNSMEGGLHALSTSWMHFSHRESCS